jgi:paxillin
MSNNRKTLEGLSDLDNLLAELEGVDNPKTDRVSTSSNQTTQIVQSEPAKGSEWDDLDNLLNKYEKPKEVPTQQSRPVSIAPPKEPAPTEPPQIQQKPMVKTVVNDDIPQPSISNEDAKRRQSVVASKAPTENNSGCSKCGQKLTGEHIKALGSLWHTTCFACDNCNSGLRGDFFESDGKRLCKDCASTKYRCTKCSLPITGEYFVGQGTMVHPHCLEKVNCAKCSQPIQLHETSALGKKYHPECFVCTECGTKLTGNFYDRGGSPFCKSCLQKNSNVTLVDDKPLTCRTCGKSITGSYVAYSGSDYHDSCFLCYKCKSILPTNGFYSIDGNATCQNCAK